MLVKVRIIANQILIIYSMKKFILSAIILVATFLPALADSPLTSTEWWRHYKEIPVIAEAHKKGCTDNVKQLICDDTKPIDVRLAAVNALGWKFEGQNNYVRCMNYYLKQKKVRHKVSAIDTIPDGYVRFSPETRCVFAYLMAMDNYFDVDLALETAIAAQELKPNDKCIAMIRALIAAQKMMDSDFCSVYRIVTNVAYDKDMPKGDSQFMVDEIMDYIKLYRDDCAD